MEFETRFVDARLNIEFEQLNDELNIKATEEYNTITQTHNNSIDKWLQSLHAKSANCKCGGSVILGEMLVHIYKKLENIENLLTSSEVHYIPLKHITHTLQLGHGVIIVDSNDLNIENVYYGRLYLPVFPMRCVPFFAIAKENNILQFNKIGERDLKDYDGYIMSVEREMLKARRMQKF